jgi:coiled-coil domain-containing protein 55
MHDVIERARARRIELEWIKDRQLEKERIAEGSMFQGKDAFVTSVYKRKLEERRALLKGLEEKDKMDASEEKSSDFYRHLLRQTGPRR